MPPWASLPFRFIGLASYLLIATGAGLRLSEEKSEQPILERALLGSAIGFGISCALIFLLGSLGLITIPVLIVVLVLMSAWGARPLSVLWREARTRFAVTDPWTPFEKLLGVVLITMVFSHLFYGYAPPAAEDELTFHISLPSLYAREGRIVEVPGNMPSYYPMNAQLLYTGVMALSNVLTVKLLIWAIGLLILAAMWNLGRNRFNMSRSECLLGIVLFSVMPYTSSLSGVVNSDFFDVFIELVVVSLVLRPQPTSRAEVIIAGALAGFGMGIRPYAGAWVLGIAVLLFLKGREWRSLVVYFGIAFLVFSPWLLRNIFLTGNPFYPKAYWSGTVENPYFTAYCKLANDTFWRDVKRIISILTFGDVLYGMGIPALAMAPGVWLIRHRASWTQMILLTAIVVAATFVFPLRSPRYFGQTYPFFALAGAAGFFALLGTVSRAAAPWLKIWLMILLLVPGTAMGVYWGSRRLPFFTGQESWNQYLEKHYELYEGYPMMRYITSHIAPGSRLLGLGSMASLEFYYPDWKIDAMPLLSPDVYRRTSGEFAHELIALKFTHVLLLKHAFVSTPAGLRFETLPEMDLVVPPLTPPHFELLLETERSTLYRIRQSEIRP